MLGKRSATELHSTFLHLLYYSVFLSRESMASSSSGVSRFTVVLSEVSAFNSNFKKNRGVEL